MIFYVSGELTDFILDFVIEHRLPLLSSFAYKSWRERCVTIAGKLRGSGARIQHILDSGAFTSWSKGSEVHLPDLVGTANYLQEAYADCIDWTFIALDKIPGTKGQAITAADAATACKISADNYGFMLRNVTGYVMPVFHTGDPAWLADTYKDAPYVGLSMSQNLSDQGRLVSGQQSAAQFVGRKLHGLAATGVRTLRITKWYSVDSASWLLWGVYGAICVMRQNGSLTMLPISNESRLVKQQDRHFTTLSAIERDSVALMIESYGLTVAQMASSCEHRTLFNLQQFQLVCSAAAKLHTFKPAGDLYA